MNDASRGIALAVSLGLVLWAGLILSAQAMAGPSADRYGLAVLIGKNGGWLGPKHADGSPNFSIIDALIRAKPKHLRITKAPMEADKTLKARNPTVRQQLWRLRRSGVRLGAAIGAAMPMDGGREQTPGEVIRHAKAVKRANGKLYGHIYLDLFNRRSHGQQRIIRGIRREAEMKVSIIANQARSIPRGTWAHVAGFDLFRRSASIQAPNWRKTLRRVANHNAPLLRYADRRWLRATRGTRSTAQLRLSYPMQTLYQLGRLSSETQRKLLRRMIRSQRRFDYALWMPLYAPGMARSWRGQGRSEAYDARTAGTYRLQARALGGLR